MIISDLLQFIKRGEILKPKVATAEERICFGRISCSKKWFLRVTRGTELLPITFTISFKSSYEIQEGKRTNNEEHRRMVKTLMKICYEEEEVLTDVAGQWRYAAMLWFVQVDVAAGVEVVDEVDGGSSSVCVALRRRG